MTVKVSVIIPVYNPDLSLLDRAVRSVQKQFYTDFELLLIDDCSTDQRVLAYLEKKSADERIRVIHQKENGGVSEARNRGILEAVGEWIAFLDQDDYYCPDFLSSLLAEADNAEIEMLMAGFYLVRGETKDRFPILPEGFHSPWLIWSTCAVWSRIYRREKLIGNGISFPKGCYTEDMIFLFQCNEILEYKIIPKWIYNNWISQESTSRSEGFKKLETGQLPYDELKKAIRSRNPKNDCYALGYIYNELALLTCILVRNSAREVCGESMRQAREVVSILDAEKSGSHRCFMKEYLTNAELDTRMKLVIRGLFEAFSFHLEKTYCMLLRSVLRRSG